MDKEWEEISRKNYLAFEDRFKKWKVRNSDESVNLALKGLCFYHCVRDSNILEVIQTQQIKTKNIIYEGEMTNSTTDLFQGFDKHLSMSIGEPWVEYGPYCFVYGIEDLSDTSMFFMADPWQYSNKTLQQSYFTKAEFINLTKLLASKNIILITKRTGIYLPFLSMDSILKWNYRKWEVKQDKCLNILEADEFMTWDSLDNILFIISRLFGSGIGLIILLALTLSIALVV